MVELVATAVPGDVGLLRISSMPCVRHLTSSMGHDVKVDTRPVRPPASALCSSVIDSLDRTRISDLTTSFTHTHTHRRQTILTTASTLTYSRASIVIAACGTSLDKFCDFVNRFSDHCSLFLLPKQVFGPRTAKSQPIWIKFCTHLLLYGIHLWADLDRDRRVGGSRPNQNDYVFFCNTCNAP